MENNRIRVGVSACLLGNNVRYDGGHQYDAYIVKTLGEYLEFVPVCPEVECGLPVPRESLRLVGDPASPRLMTRETRVDLTEHMQAWAEKRLEALEKLNLCGFIFKSGSPSSGMERIRVYPHPDTTEAEPPQGTNKKRKGTRPPVHKGVGIFARAFMERFPLIPVEDDGRLHDPGLRENFIERLFTMKRWRAIEDTPERQRIGALVEFHTRHKLLIMAHSPEHYRSLGRFVAKAKEFPQNELLTRYRDQLLTALALRTTPRKHANVLQHILGYFKNDLSSDEKKEMLDIIEHHRSENLPLIVPVTLMNHYVRKYRQPYLTDQYYLTPHPLELKLRNHG